MQVDVRARDAGVQQTAHQIAALEEFLAWIPEGGWAPDGGWSSGRVSGPALLKRARASLGKGWGADGMAEVAAGLTDEYADERLPLPPCCVTGQAR